MNRGSVRWVGSFVAGVADFGVKSFGTDDVAARDHRAHEGAEHAVRIDVLSREEDVGDAGAVLHVAGGTEGEVFLHPVKVRGDRCACPASEPRRRSAGN